MKTILLDATNISNRPTGAGNYAMSILRALPKDGVTVLVSAALDKNHEFFSLGFAHIALPVSTVGPKRDLVLWWYLLRNKNKFSSYTSFMPYAPLGISFPSTTITIHDLTFWKYKPYVPLLKRWYLQFIIRQSMKKCHSIITVSEATKEDIKAFMHVSVPIYVVPNGIDVKDFASGNSKRRHKRPYILHVGEHRPHKNIKQLLYAFSFLKKRGFEHDLVLIGKAYKDSEKQIQEIVTSLHLEKYVKILHGVSTKELYGWYTHADVFVFPSLYEGFGIPLLEAMAAQTPIVTSNVSAMKEVAGDAAMLADPYSAKDIADAIERVLEDSGAAKSLVQAGKKRVKEFSWKAFAAAFDSVMRKNEE